MRLERRKFIKTSLAVGVAMAVPDLLNGLAAGAQTETSFPWQRETPLREAAQSRPNS
jgi:hypothetical protein